jgi:hypothetical protein
LQAVCYPVGVISLITFFFIGATSAFGEATKSENVTRHNEDVVKVIRPFHPDAQIPGTNIKLGSIVISAEDVQAYKIAFEVDKQIYYLDEVEGVSRSKSSFSKHGFQVYTEPWYGIYSDMLLLRGAAGATGANTWMFLFGFNSKGVYLIDALENNYIRDARYELYPVLGAENEFYALQDIDKDGYPEVLVDFGAPHFHLFFELSYRGMQVNLNPVLYTSKFKSLHEKPKRTEKEFREYLVYGYLSGAMSREEIIAELRKKWKKEHIQIIDLIYTLPKLNEVLHPRTELTLKELKSGQ